MPARVEFTRSAEKEFGRLPREVQRRFADAIPLVAESPRRARAGADVRKLRGTRGAWRLRVGDWRGIYECEGGKVVFTRFAHRSKVYDV